MTTWQITLLGAYGVVLAWMIQCHLSWRRALRRTTVLKPIPPRPWEVDDYWPFVSIVVPAKDEATGIEECVRSLLAQDYPHFEVLVVDDRSTDGVGPIVERMLREDRRVRLVTVNELPAGWTGKSHALDVGRRQARGDWFAFIDADLRHDTTCLTALLREALQRRADVVSVLPAFESDSAWENVVYPAAWACVIDQFPLAHANDSKRLDGGYANGQLLLARRSAYEEIGGHEAVRDELDDGLGIGRRARRAGLRVRVVIGSAVARARSSSIRGSTADRWGRRLFAAAEGRTTRIALMGFVLALQGAIPSAVVAASAASCLAGTATAFAKASLAAGLIHEALARSLSLRRNRIGRVPLRWLAFRWIGTFATLRIVLRAATLCQARRVTWRGTTYGTGLGIPPQAPAPDAGRSSAAA